MTIIKSLANTFNSDKKKIVLLLIALAGISILLYINSFDYDFLKDDFRLIVENPRIKDFKSFKDSLGTKFFAFPDFPYLHYWRPLSLFSFYLDYQLWGLNPSGFHFTNILINTANVLLVFLILYLLTNKILFAFFASLFFSVHPSHVEAVTWISGRTDLLAAFFVMSAMLFFILFLEKRHILYYILTILFFLPALLSKENAVLFPLLAIGLVFIKSNRMSSLKNQDTHEIKAAESNTKKSVLPMLLFTLPFWIIDIGYAILHNHFSKVQDVVNGFSFKDIFTIIKTIGAYTKIILTPYFPTPHFSMRWFDQSYPELLLYFALAVLLITLIFMYRKKYTFSLYSFIFLLFLLPVLDPEIVPSYPKIVIRFAYIPSIFAGIFLLDTLNIFRNKRLKTTFILILIAIGMIWTFESNRFQIFFKDQYHHYNDSTGLTRYFPEDCSLLLPLALIKAQSGEFQNALDLVNHALKVNDQDRWLDITEMGGLLKANLLVITGDRNRGKDLAEKIIAETHKDEMKYFGYLVLAKYYEKNDNLVEALQMLNKAEQTGSTADLYFRIALIYGKMKNYPQAFHYIDRAISLNPIFKTYREFKAFLQIQPSGSQ